MQDRKKIYIHIGLPKTGSSALQAYLSYNADVLNSLGISYPSPESRQTIDAGVCTGNLLHVALSRAAAEKAIGERSELVGRYIKDVFIDSIESATTKDVLFSGEFLYLHAREAVFEIVKELSDVHDVHVIAFVRDVYFHATSSWKQHVKATNQNMNFMEYIRERHSLQKLSIQGLEKYLDSGVSISFLNYDRHRANVFMPFMNMIRPSVDMSIFSPLALSENNRSISFRQAAMAVLLQKNFGISKLTANVLSKYRRLHDTRPDPYLPEVDAFILDALRPLITRVNDRLGPEDRLRETPLTPSHATSAEFSEDDLALVLGEVALFVSEGTQVYRAPDLPGLPKGFDPEEYLLRNPDVAAAGMDPVFHYLNHGRYEGRPIGTVRADDV